jgi:hypothetical protein
VGYSFIFVIFFSPPSPMMVGVGGCLYRDRRIGNPGARSGGRFSMEDALFSPEEKTDSGLSQISSVFSSVVVRRRGGYKDVEL